MCGENHPVPQISAYRPGSPPRVRGKRKRSLLSRRRLWITPACAGKTNICINNRSISKDHPRVCGENKLIGKESPNGAGSPPRVRGKHIFSVFLFFDQRITPACAGKTHPSPITVTFDVWITPACAGKTFLTTQIRDKIQDHPRVCGEN